VRIVRHLTTLVGRSCIPEIQVSVSLSKASLSSLTFTSLMTITIHLGLPTHSRYHFDTLLLEINSASLLSSPPSFRPPSAFSSPGQPLYQIYCLIDPSTSPPPATAHHTRQSCTSPTSNCQTSQSCVPEPGTQKPPSIENASSSSNSWPPPCTLQPTTHVPHPHPPL
jgi:hypothetical protein